MRRSLKIKTWIFNLTFPSLRTWWSWIWNLNKIIVLFIAPDDTQLIDIPKSSWAYYIQIWREDYLGYVGVLMSSLILIEAPIPEWGMWRGFHLFEKDVKTICVTTTRLDNVLKICQPLYSTFNCEKTQVGLCESSLWSTLAFASQIPGDFEIWNLARHST